MDPGTPPSPRWQAPSRVALALAAILAATAAAYAPSLDGGFVLDDEQSLQEVVAQGVRGETPVPGPRELLGTTRPVTGLTFLSDWNAAGLDARRFHVTSLALHLVTALVAFAFLLGLLRRARHPRAAGVALAVTALFALHPIQAESVAYVSQRAEVLSALFYLASLLLLDAAARGWGMAPGWRWIPAWVGGVVGWGVAMGAKATAISLPGAFVAEELVVPPRGDGPREVARRGLRALLLVVPIAVLASWSAWLQFADFAAHPNAGAGFAASSLSGGAYFLTQLRVQWLYLRLLAWPQGLVFDRPFDASHGVDGEVALAAAGVAALVGLALWLWFRAGRAEVRGAAARAAAFGILFWFIALAPTSSFVPVADLAVEHRVYLAALGPFLAAVVGVDALLARWLAPRARGIAALALAAVVVVALGLALRSRAETWASPTALMREAVEAAPGSERANTNMALALRRQGDLAGADAYFRRAWQVVRRPEGVVVIARNYGGLLLDTGRPGEALAVLDRGLALLPGDGLLLVNRSVAQGMLGRYDEALADARGAARADPNRPEIRNMLGVALCAVGQCEAALPEFRAAEALDPGNPVFPVKAAIALTIAGRRDDACATYRRAQATSRVRPLPFNAAAGAAALGCPIE